MKKDNSKALKRISAAAVLASGIILLTGCGSKEPDGYYVLDSVTEGKTKVKEADLGEYGLDDSYAVFVDGDGYIVFMGTPEIVTYDADKGVIHTTFGDISAKLSGKTLTLADSNVTMKFTYSKDDTPPKPGYPTVSVPETDDDWLWGDSSDGSDDYNSEDDPYAEFNQMTDALKEYAPDVDWDNFDWNSYDWTKDEYDLVTFFNTYEGFDDAYSSASSGDISDFWNGFWFGYWTLDAWDDQYEDYEDYKFAILGYSTMDDDGNTTIYLWDNDYEIAEVSGTNNGNGLTSYGTFISEDGYFWNGDRLGHADWNVDPGIDAHDNSFRVDGRCYYDGEKMFDYEIRMVKWGETWDDFDSDDLPDEYGWYCDQIKKGITDPTDLTIEEN